MSVISKAFRAISSPLFAFMVASCVSFFSPPPPPFFSLESVIRLEMKNFSSFCAQDHQRKWTSLPFLDRHTPQALFSPAENFKNSLSVA